jgi:DNA modification methylase
MLNQILTGDARELAKSIEPNSISLIFCDPVYENIEDYTWLAETALRVLKPDSACLAWCSKQKLPECQMAMKAAGLDFESILFYVVRAKQTPSLFHYGLKNWTTPCLWFAKGNYKCSPIIVDTFIDDRRTPENFFKWQKNTPVIEKWIRDFSKPGDLILDPFAGSGTVPAVCRMTGRNFIGFEIDPARAAEARQRVEHTPTPLFHYEPENNQQRMAI